MLTGVNLRVETVDNNKKFVESIFRNTQNHVMPKFSKWLDLFLKPDSK